MWYDVVVIAILIVGMVRGAVRGVIWQLAGIAGIVLCMVFAETISHVGSPYVKLDPPLNQWVVMFVAYLFFSFLSFGFARLIHGALEKAQLKEYNKHLGAIFGLLKGAVLCLVLTFFLVTLSEKTRGMLKDSKSARYAAVIMDRLHPVMPEKLRGALNTYIEDLDADDLDLKYATGRQASPDDPNQPSDADSTWDPLNSSGTSPADNWSGSPFETGTAGSTSSQPVAGDAINEMLKRIPGLSNDYMRDWVRQVYEATPKSRRQQLVQQLTDSGPALISAVLQQWQSQPAQPVTTPANPANDSGMPDFGSTTQPVGFSEAPAQSRQSLVAVIAAKLARNPQDQPAYEQYINGGLQGLPDAVSLGVLQDWQTDLIGGTDPDPQTNAGTTLDQRIIRQLTLQRVSVFQLSQELQTRLMNSRQQ